MSSLGTFNRYKHLPDDLGPPSKREGSTNHWNPFLFTCKISNEYCATASQEEAQQDCSPLPAINCSQMPLSSESQSSAPGLFQLLPPS